MLHLEDALLLPKVRVLLVVMRFQMLGVTTYTASRDAWLRQGRTSAFIGPADAMVA